MPGRHHFGIIDRGDVIYDPPFDEKGKPAPFSRRPFPKITLRTRYKSQLIPLMNDNVAKFPQLKVFSLPSILPGDARRIELGVRGDPAQVDAAIEHLRAGVRAMGFPFDEIK